MRRDYSGESLSGRSARGAADQIGYGTQSFRLSPRQGRVDFLFALQRVEPAIDVVAQHPPVSSGQGLSLGAILGHGELRIRLRALRVLRGERKCFFSRGFWRRLAGCGILRDTPDARLLRWQTPEAVPALAHRLRRTS